MHILPYHLKRNQVHGQQLQSYDRSRVCSILGALKLGRKYDCDDQRVWSVVWPFLWHSCDKNNGLRAWSVHEETAADEEEDLCVLEIRLELALKPDTRHRNWFEHSWNPSQVIRRVLNIRFKYQCCATRYDCWVWDRDFEVRKRWEIHSRISWPQARFFFHRRCEKIH